MHSPIGLRREIVEPKIQEDRESQRHEINLDGQKHDDFGGVFLRL